MKFNPTVKHQSFLGTAVILLAVNFLTPGYSFGYGEQMLLSVKGISWADRNAFVGDWFNDHAPQPHIVFDVITYFGEKINFLAGVYLLYYVASCFAFALATALLAEKWLPQRLQYLQHLVNTLCVVGPVFLLGTFLTIHFQSVPNMAGGCLVYLTIACLITNRESLAAAAMPLTALMHLQHGIGVASIAILFIVFGLVERKKLILLSSAISLGISFAFAFSRDLLSGSSEIAGEAAEIGSTGHLNVETWTTPVIIGGLFVIGLAVLNFVLKDSHGRRGRITIAVTIIALGPVIGIVADLYNIEPFQSLARSFFIYRYSMFLAPFSCWFLVRNLAKAGNDNLYLALTSFAIFIAGFIGYFSVTYSNFPRLKSAWVLAGLASLAGAIQLTEKKSFSRLNYGLVPMAYLAIISSILGFAQFGSRWPQVGFSSTDNAVTISRSMGMALNSYDVLASDPSIPWIRPLTRRAIVADCKGVPYGGKPWYEYTRRLRALGVDKPNVCLGYKALPLGKLVELRQSVGATAVLLLPDDAAYRDAKKSLTVRWSSGGENPWIIFELPVVKRSGE